MLIDHEQYAPSMLKFLNQFSMKCQAYETNQKEYLAALFLSFVRVTDGLSDRAFVNQKTGRFSIALIEAVFTASAHQAFAERRTLAGDLEEKEIRSLSENREFQDAATKASTTSSNVERRLELGKQIITAL